MFIRIAVTQFLLASQVFGITQIPSGQSVVLDKAEGIRLAKQCSRASVKGVDNVWVPSQQEIGELESRLPGYLAKVFPKVHARLPRCYFQYIGFQVGKRRIIYVNSFDENRVHNEVPELVADWQHEAVLACDGGPTYWGIEFNIATKEFSGASFNGSP